MCYKWIFFRYRHMKNLTFIYIHLLLFIPGYLSAQMYMRTRNNIGVVANYNFSLNDALNKQSISIGITRQFGAYILPELGCRLNMNEMNRENSTMNNDSFLFGALNYRKRLFLINKRRVGSCCKAELVEVLCAPEYFSKIGNNKGLNSKNIRLGMGIYHVQSGYGKKSKSWTLKIEGYYRIPINISTESSIKNEVGVQVRILRHQIYDFLN